MAWKLSTSLTTASLPGVTVKINKDDLQPGDIMLKDKPASGGFGHTLLFEKWAKPDKSEYWTYEQHGPNGSPTAHRTLRYPYNNDKNYRPLRYKDIK